MSQRLRVARTRRRQRAVVEDLSRTTPLSVVAVRQLSNAYGYRLVYRMVRGGVPWWLLRSAGDAYLSPPTIGDLERIGLE